MININTETPNTQTILQAWIPFKEAIGVTSVHTEEDYARATVTIDVLRFLMEQHGLHQEDLSDCAPQSRISEILTGKRSISKENAKRFARRFNVHGDLFL